jgi:type IV pilus assembly protein PilQ
MQFILRFLVLGSFAAAGVALAISVAANTQELASTWHSATAEETVPESKPAEQEPAQHEAANQEIATEETVAQMIASEIVPAPVVPTLPVAAPPLVAPYRPRMANQLDSMLQAIDRVESKQRETAQAVSMLQQQQLLPAPDGESERPALEQAETIPLDSSRVTILPDSNLIDVDAQDSDIRYVLKLLSEAGGLNILASQSVFGQVSASLRNVPIEEALTAILKSTGFVYQREGKIIYVGTPEELQGMEHVAELVGTRVYRPNYVAATELEILIAPLLSSVGKVTVSSPPQVGIASNSSEAGGDSFAGGDLVMVRDYVSILTEVDHLMSQVDCMPLQVAIEATILSVKLDDKNVLGVDFELLRQKDTVRITSGTPLSSLMTADFQDGLKIGFLDSSLSAFIEAVETIGETSVVASPRVMCLNKQRAEILIGSELGYVSTTVTETAATQAVEFLEVGTKLLIRPYISSDGVIRMEVHPELSTGSVRVEAGFTLPDKEVTQVTTNIMCMSDSTIVLGGLIREDLMTSSTQIPVLGNLPLVGTLFRQSTEDIERSEIIVLLTPRIVDGVTAANEGEQYSGQFQERRDVFADKMSPISRQHIAENYARKATSAYHAGDLPVALRYANLAIQFSPLHQGAVDLRREITSIAPDLESGVHHHLRSGLAPWQHPIRDYSRHGVPWELESEQPQSPLHFYLDDHSHSEHPPQLAPITPGGG